MRALGYVRYAEQKPERRMFAECADESGLNSWIAQIGPDCGSMNIPHWWRPHLTTHELWQELISQRNRIERLRGGLKWCSGRLFDLGDTEGANQALDMAGDKENEK